MEERRSADRAQIKPRPDQHSGSLNNWEESAAFGNLQTVRLSSLLGFHLCGSYGM